MKTFDELLRENLAADDAPPSDLVWQAPGIYRLLTALLEDPALPGRLRPLVLAAVAYFVLPQDIVPEDLRGPRGYADDIFLAAFVANRVLQETASEHLLTDNWEGDTPVLSLLADILAREQELIGDQRDLILWYIGYEYLCFGASN